MGLKKIDGLGVPVRRLLACFGALTAALVLLLLLSSPSYALIHRGHTLGATFGEAFGEGDKLSGPSDVAVNEATGDVYVLDGANNRVVRFGPGPEHAIL